MLNFTDKICNQQVVDSTSIASFLLRSTPLAFRRATQNKPVLCVKSRRDPLVPIYFEWSSLICIATPGIEADQALDLIIAKTMFDVFP